MLRAPRFSRDIDLFHDSAQALRKSWEADARELREAAYAVEILHEAPSFVEAVVSAETESVVVQWVRDSAFRFFPVQEDDLLGLTLHPFDLATNKILAAAGRLEPRDWIDVLACHRDLQPLGYIAWAACGKDPGLNPDMILDQFSRLHYSQEEIDHLDFEDQAPLSARLSAEWKRAVEQGRGIIAALPADHVGECVLRADGSTLYRGNTEELKSDLRLATLAFHKGTIGGVWPRIVGS